MYTRFLKLIIGSALFMSISYHVPLYSLHYLSDDTFFEDTREFPLSWKEWWAQGTNKKRVAVGLGLVTGIAACCYYRAPLSAWLIRQVHNHWWHNSTIFFMNNKVIGKEITREINGHTVTISQIHVKSQFEKGGGGSASCGYGALFWADRLQKSLMGKMTLRQKDFYDEKAIADSHGPEGIRRKRIHDMREQENIKITARNEELKKKKRKCALSPLASLSSDWLDSAEIYSLIKAESKVREVTVCADVKEILNPHMHADIIRQCRYAINNGEPFSHAFIIGTMEHSLEKHGMVAARDKGHYITLVFYTNGKGSNKYIITDTANGLRIQDKKIVTPVIDLIETIDGGSFDYKGKGEA